MQPYTELLTEPIHNSQSAEMSSETTVESALHRSSPSKSSSKESEVDEVGDDDMWCNELQQKDLLLPEVEPKKQELSRKYSNLADIAIRLMIVLVFFKLETMPAFKREIHVEELWLYKNPIRPDIVKSGDLLFLVITVPFVLTSLVYAFTKDRRDFRAASWAWTLAVCMNSIPTSLLKITVGRPRPDFYYRCFPDGVMVLNETASALGNALLDFNCTGKPSIINEGRKSFPSGHSSFAFASFGFVTYYVGAKLHAFDARGRGQTWRMCIAVIPLIVASLVAVSRTCDYHHHWQDVTVGSLIGLFSGYISYRQYYPSIFANNAGKPYVRWPNLKQSETDSIGEPGSEACSSLLGKQTSKWC
ncbi:phospholipid phosphatase 5 isoform X2 [Drosophila navojoa]|uniref:phospholipid phosphatase 5 isoform X2 n=1 Tax=Drosophila navojoa TaxID=7232 RepID=UPI000847A2ED|nr:phospholipid phosphatase 5 isoform X2 [Drosophila navojoa]